MFILAAILACASAQDLPAFVEQERRAEMGLPAAGPGGFSWDWGGYLRADAFFIDDKPFEDNRAFRYYDLRLWALAEWDRDWRLYGRTYTQGLEYNSGDGFGDDAEWRVLRADVLWLEYSGGRIVDPAIDVTTRVGRQFFSLGRGTLFLDNADGLKLEFNAPIGNLGLFAAKSIPDADDIDPTRPDADESDRFYYGTELSWTAGPENHVLYALGFVSDDKKGDSVGVQEFDYDPWYVGLGVKGNPQPRLSYQAELLYEGGTSTAEFGSAREGIRAWSVSERIDYFPESPWDLRFSAEYLFGSGDSDRAIPTGTFGGNDPGSVDRGFASFGYVPTGYALFPRLSNLHVAKFGATFKPFLDSPDELLRNMELGATYFYFLKHREDGGISDSRATTADRDVGHELDVFWRWRVLSDLGIQARVGIFLPGDAYPSAGGTDDPRLFVSTGFVFAF